MLLDYRHKILHKMPRVLCLHAFYGDGKAYRRSLAALEQALPECEFIYVTSPRGATSDNRSRHWALAAARLAISCCPAIIAQYMPAVQKLGELREWFNADTSVDPAIFRGQDETLPWLLAWAEEHGPFDAVIGTSQGATQAASLIARAPTLFRAAVFVVGRLPRTAAMLAQFKTATIDIPTAHVLGTRDPIKWQSDLLVDRCPGAEVLEVNSGHAISLGEGSTAHAFVLSFLRRTLLAGSVEIAAANAWSRSS